MNSVTKKRVTLVSFEGYEHFQGRTNSQRENLTLSTLQQALRDLQPPVVGPHQGPQQQQPQNVKGQTLADSPYGNGQKANTKQNNPPPLDPRYVVKDNPSTPSFLKYQVQVHHRMRTEANNMSRGPNGSEMDKGPANTSGLGNL